MDPIYLILGGACFMGTSLFCYHAYDQELKKHKDKKDFWKYSIKNAFTGPRGFMELVAWNMIIIVALPIGIIRRFKKWMKKSLRS